MDVGVMATHIRDVIGKSRRPPLSSSGVENKVEYLIAEEMTRRSGGVSASTRIFYLGLTFAIVMIPSCPPSIPPSFTRRIKRQLCKERPSAIVQDSIQLR